MLQVVQPGRHEPRVEPGEVGGRGLAGDLRAPPPEQPQQLRGVPGGHLEATRSTGSHTCVAARASAWRTTIGVSMR